MTEPERPRLTDTQRRAIQKRIELLQEMRPDHKLSRLLTSDASALLAEVERLRAALVARERQLTDLKAIHAAEQDGYVPSATLLMSERCQHHVLAFCAACLSLEGGAKD